MQGFYSSFRYNLNSLRSNIAQEWPHSQQGSPSPKADNLDEIIRFLSYVTDKNYRFLSVIFFPCNVDFSRRVWIFKGISWYDTLSTEVWILSFASVHPHYVAMLYPGFPIYVVGHMFNVDLATLICFTVVIVV